MITDTCRALLLEIAGYNTNIFEFIGGEHTVHNILHQAFPGTTVILLYFTIFCSGEECYDHGC